jgi:hypothetical protein
VDVYHDQLGMSLSILTVDGLPAGGRFTLRGGTFYVGAHRMTTIGLANCLGDIHLEQVSFAKEYAQQSYSAALSVGGCERVTVSRCDLRGDPALRANDSSILVTGTSAKGLDSAYIGPGFPTYSSPAIRSTDANLVLSECTILGGDGYTDLLITVPPQPGIWCYGGEILIAGSSAAHVQAGSLAGYSASAIDSTWTSLVLDPAAPLIPSGGAPPISGPHQLQTQSLPRMDASSTAPGGTVTAHLYSPAGDLFEVYLGLPAPPASLGPLGSFWLDPAFYLFVDRGVQGPAAHWSASIPVPPDPSLTGLLMRFQALSGTLPAGIHLSTPAGFAIF